MRLPVNTVINGDCIAEMRRLPPRCARLVVADPPYFRVLPEQAWDTQWPGMDAYLRWSAQWMKAARRLLMPGGLLYCCGQPGKREHVMLHLMAQATRIKRKTVDWEFHDLIIWDRVVGYNERRDSFTPAYEMILVLRKPGPVLFNKDAVREPYDAPTRARYGRDRRYKDPDARFAHLEAGKYATNLWRIPSLKGASREKVGHPSQKPCELIERIVLSSSQPGDLIIDPFLGSGTTAVVAQQSGRRWSGIESSPEYVAMARARLEQQAPLDTPSATLYNDN